MVENRPLGQSSHLFLALEAFFPKFSTVLQIQKLRKKSATTALNKNEWEFIPRSRVCNAENW